MSGATSETSHGQLKFHRCLPANWLLQLTLTALQHETTAQRIQLHTQTLPLSQAFQLHFSRRTNSPLYCCRFRAKFLTLKVRHCRLSPTETALQSLPLYNSVSERQKSKTKGRVHCVPALFFGFITDAFPQRIAIRLRHANRLLCPQVGRF